MTVAELIGKLQKAPPGMLVFCYGEGRRGDIDQVRISDGRVLLVDDPLYVDDEPYRDDVFL